MEVPQNGNMKLVYWILGALLSLLILGLNFQLTNLNTRMDRLEQQQSELSSDVAVLTDRTGR